MFDAIMAEDSEKLLDDPVWDRFKIFCHVAQHVPSRDHPWIDFSDRLWWKARNSLVRPPNHDGFNCKINGIYIQYNGITGSPIYSIGAKINERFLVIADRTSCEIANEILCYIVDSKFCAYSSSPEDADEIRAALEMVM